jgi:hypothetical protein
MTLSGGGSSASNHHDGPTRPDLCGPGSSPSIGIGGPRSQPAAATMHDRLQVVAPVPPLAAGPAPGRGTGHMLPPPTSSRSVVDRTSGCQPQPTGVHWQGPQPELGDPRGTLVPPGGAKAAQVQVVQGALPGPLGTYLGQGHDAGPHHRDAPGVQAHSFTHPMTIPLMPVIPLDLQYQPMPVHRPVASGHLGHNPGARVLGPGTQAGTGAGGGSHLHAAGGSGGGGGGAGLSGDSAGGAGRGSGPGSAPSASASGCNARPLPAAIGSAYQLQVEDLHNEEVFDVFTRLLGSGSPTYGNIVRFVCAIWNSTQCEGPQRTWRQVGMSFWP